MIREVECRLHCERCNDTLYTVYRVPAKNEGVFLNKFEPKPPTPPGIEIRCPMCTGRLERI